MFRTPSWKAATNGSTSRLRSPPRDPVSGVPAAAVARTVLITVNVHSPDSVWPRSPRRLTLGGFVLTPAGTRCSGRCMCSGFSPGRPHQLGTAPRSCAAPTRMPSRETRSNFESEMKASLEWCEDVGGGGGHTRTLAGARKGQPAPQCPGQGSPHSARQPFLACSQMFPLDFANVLQA